MAFRRRYARRAGRKNKYNINTTTWEDIPSTSWAQVSGGLYYTVKDIVPASTVGGTRKVKRFVINMALPINSNMINWWALVYVPEGTTVSKPSLSGEGYQPSQFVISQGMLTANSPVRINSPMSRNLNQNDKISLVVWHDFGGDPTNVALGGFLQYALCYN